MLTHAQVAVRLLRDAATFFRTVADQNPEVAEQMHDNAAVYDRVAELLEQDPSGVLDLDS